MATTARQSGFFIQSGAGNRGNFEVVISDVGAGRPKHRPLPTSQEPARTGNPVVDTLNRLADNLARNLPGGSPRDSDNLQPIVRENGNGLIHFWRDNDQGDPDKSWHGPGLFAGGDVRSASLIQSNYGALEVVTRLYGQLVHYYSPLGSGGWEKEKEAEFPTGVEVTGNPAFIQSTYGGRGNFEVVAPRVGGGLVHYRRDNDAPTPRWSIFRTFGDGDVQAVSMIQGNFGDPGSLELVARDGDTLVHYWYDGEWHKDPDGPFARGVDGEPSLIQSSSGSKGNFEVVVPRSDGGLVHYRRDNDHPKLLWSEVTPAPFHGTGDIDFWETSLIQSNYGALEVVARIRGYCSLIHFWNSGGGWNRSENNLDQLCSQVK